MPALADPGGLFTGDVPAAASMIDEPLRRLRETGADLLAEFGRRAPIDVWGVDSDALTAKFRSRVHVRVGLVAALVRRPVEAPPHGVGVRPLRPAADLLESDPQWPTLNISSSTTVTRKPQSTTMCSR